MENTNVSVPRNERNTLTYYPNPSNGYITFTKQITSELLINLFSSDGKLVLKKKLDSIDKTLDVNGLNRGLYFIKISGENINICDILIIE